MPFDQQSVIDLLSERYAGAVATRCLWMSAGGEHQDIEYDLAPAERWSVMWSKAVDGGPPIAFVLREALFDEPGDEALLVALEELAQELGADDDEAAELFLARLSALDEAFDPNHLCAALLALPEWTLEQAFASLTDHLEGQLHLDYRDLLVEHLEDLRSSDAGPSLDSLQAGGLFLVDSLPEIEDPNAIEGFDQALADLRIAAESPPPRPEPTGETEARPEPDAETDPLAFALGPAEPASSPGQQGIDDPFAETLAGLKSLVEPASSAAFMSALAGLERYSAYRTAKELPSSPQIPSQASIHALWATSGLPRRDPEPGTPEEGADGESESDSAGQTSANTGGTPGPETASTSGTEPAGAPSPTDNEPGEPVN